MSGVHPGFRIFILGAGFSRLAGLPLGPELFPEVLRRIRKRYGTDTKFERDLSRYIEYRRDCDDVTLSISDIDLEDFLSYLDIEHFLGLRGGDTWSEEGNESQICVRQAIGSFIQNRTPPADRLPDAYYRFAERFSVHDVVITFNYDIVLERALEHVGKPYRLFPHRFKSIHQGHGVVDAHTDELTVFKLHGSVDWFSNREFLQQKERVTREFGATRIPIHDVFDDPVRFGVEPIVEGLRFPDDPLLYIHRIRDVDSYYAHDRDFHAPLLLSPSHVKFAYSSPIKDLWFGIGQAGGYNLGVSIIGYSLPEHDSYIRLALYQLVTSYQEFEWNQNLLGVVKDCVKLIDCANNCDDVAKYKKRYCFVDQSKSSYLFDGFGSDAIRFIFDRVRAE